MSRLRFIRHAKELGFRLKEIKELLELRVDPQSTHADVRRRARDKIADIEERIAGLERMKDALERPARKCRGKGPAEACPIWKSSIESTIAFDGARHEKEQHEQEEGRFKSSAPDAQFVWKPSIS